MAGTSWPDLLAGRTAKASEVEARFDWMEGDIVPQTAGSQTDGVYNLGTTAARWLGVYTKSINPTSTAGGVAIGTTTANADSLLDIAGIKALIIPRMTTAQKLALAGAAGMMVYDTTLNLFQVYENGGWSAMGIRNGVVTKVVGITTNTTTADIVNITTAGRLVGVMFGHGAGAINASTITITLDSVTAQVIQCNTITSGVFCVVRRNMGLGGGLFFGASVTSADLTTTADTNYALDLNFKTNLRVQASEAGGATTTTVVMYETAA